MNQPRLAGASDAAAIADVYLRARHAAVPAIPPLVHNDDEVRDWMATVVIPAGNTWVIEIDGVVVAMLVLEGGEIDQLYVDSASTGNGLGSDLVDHAKRHHPDGLTLCTFQSNTGARRFYERHGFVAVATSDGDNEEGAPDVAYRWGGLTDNS